MKIDFLDTNVQFAIIILIVLIIAGYMYFSKTPEQPTIEPTIGQTKPRYTKPGTDDSKDPTDPSSGGGDDEGDDDEGDDDATKATDPPTVPPTTDPSDKATVPPIDNLPDNSAYIKWRGSWGDSGSGISFTKDGKVDITINGGNLYRTSYKIKLKDGKIHLYILSEKDGKVSFDSVRAETEIEREKNIKKSAGHIGQISGSSMYLTQVGDKMGLYIFDRNNVYVSTLTNFPFSYIFTNGIADASLEDESILEKSGIKLKYPWYSTSNESTTEGIRVIWPPQTDDENDTLGFLSYYGKTTPGKESFNWVEYNNGSQAEEEAVPDFNSVPTLVFLNMSPSDFTQLGGSHQNTSGWAYDSNFGKSDKVTAMWVSSGSYLDEWW